MPAYLLALDQGTTSCRAILFRTDGSLVHTTQRPLAQHYPKPGWVEQDADEIWRVQLACLQDTVRQAGVDPAAIQGVGLTNQRETLVVWERASGRPVHPAISWQCRRTADICDRLKAQGLEPLIRQRTGLTIDAYFTATKLMWLLEQEPGLREQARQGDLCAGTVDSWLIYQLTAGALHITDVTNASRTMLMNLDTATWDDDLLAHLDIPRALLPEIRPSSGFVASIDPSILPGQVPLCGLAGDQQAALFGQACFEAGMAKNTYGTGCFLLMNTGEKPVFSQNGLLTTVAWDLGQGPTYALEGSVFHAGSVLTWLRDDLGLIQTYDACDELAASVPDTGGVNLVPAFTGLGAPYWEMQARGLLVGLTRGSSRAHVVRAALEAVAQQSCDVLDCMVRDAGSAMTLLRVDGGLSVSDWTMQAQADLSGLAVDRPTMVETTAWGAASLAGLACGAFASLQDLLAIRQHDRLFEPKTDGSDRTRRRGDWIKAVETACFYARENP